MIDHACEVFAVSKWVGVKAKDARHKLGDEKGLASVKETKARIAKQMIERLEDIKEQQKDVISLRHQKIAGQLSELTPRHKFERLMLKARQNERRNRAAKDRQARYSKGLLSLWDRFTGKHKRIKLQNEHETTLALQRDEQEKDALINTQMNQRRSLEKRIQRLEWLSHARGQTLDQDFQQYHDIKAGKRDAFETIEASTERGPTLGR